MNQISKTLELARSMTNPHRGKRNKFRAIRTIIGGVSFHSKGEAERWVDLKHLESAGEITGLRRQVKFDLFAWSQEGPVKIGTYAADFQYRDLRTNVEITEDFKGMTTAAFTRTQKIMKANYGIEILVTRK